LISENLGLAGIILLLVEIVLALIQLEIDLITILVERGKLRGLINNYLLYLLERVVAVLRHKKS